MVDQYYAVVFSADESSARRVFDQLDATHWLRLVRLDQGLYAVYLPFARDAESALPELGTIATAVSKWLSTLALAVCSYMQARSRGRFECIFRSSVFQNGERSREFGDEEEVWVPLDEDGFPVLEGQRFGKKELSRRRKQHKHGFGCIRTAVNAGLEATGLLQRIDQRGLEIALKYEEKGWVAEKVRA